MKKLLSLAVMILLLPLTSQAGNTVYVPIETNRGSASIPLVRKGDGFVGPRGEYYPTFPSKKTLSAVYGAATPNPAPVRPASKGGNVKVVTIPGGVKILRNGKVSNVIRTKYPDVRGWKLIRENSAIVIKSGVNRDPGFVEMFDVKTGQRLDKIKATDIKGGKPAWAKNFAE